MPRDDIEHNEETATLLMVHHLTLAASLFENTHDDGGKRAREMIRQCLGDGWSTAAELFLDHLVQYYAAIGLEQDGACNDNAEDDEEGA